MKKNINLYLSIIILILIIVKFSSYQGLRSYNITQEIVEINIEIEELKKVNRKTQNNLIELDKVKTTLSLYNNAFKKIINEKE